MSTIDNKLKAISNINTLQQRDQWVNHLHPLVKLLLTFIYIISVVSISKYNLSKMLVFAIYPFFCFNLADLNFRDAIYRMRLILPLVMVVGIFNPIFDRDIMLYIGGNVMANGEHVGGLAISAGVISMLTLMLKGVYAVLATYILIATTSIEEICYAMRKLHVPQILVLVILLINRYIYILGEEASRIMTAYKLRAPSQKGIHYKAWGPLVGQWLIRSMDRAETVYESMQLRGFNGEYRYVADQKTRATDVIYFMVWLAVFAVFRFTNVVELLGGLFV
ncbi:MAG: cobalt ECF transporter T component CbiQ [Lachnospiraceae bacterium]|nr:cobalt ECF transporter T component CbiQ [Lachnospiraceae bacterium]